jgi:hypothetical protein
MTSDELGSDLLTFTSAVRLPMMTSPMDHTRNLSSTKHLDAHLIPLLDTKPIIATFEPAQQ